MSIENDSPQSCFGCEFTEENKVLISFRYKSNDRWVCLECLPKLIHGQKSVEDYS